MQRKAIIYTPAKNAMQSGTRNTQSWILEFASDDRKFVDEMMGWIGGADTTRQLKLKFDSEAEAIAYAEEHNLAYETREPHQRSPHPKSYAKNFAFDRRKYSDIAANLKEKLGGQ